MGSAKSGSSAAWFDKLLASPYGANGQITMTMHNYRPKQLHEILNGVNFKWGKSIAKTGPNLRQIWQLFGPWASPYGANGQRTMAVHNYRPRQFHRTSGKIRQAVTDMGSASLAGARPAAHPPGPWRQYPSSPEGWGVKKVRAHMKLIFHWRRQICIC